jgi:hypothetical protein
MVTPPRQHIPHGRLACIGESRRGRAAFAVAATLLSLTQLYACSSASPLPPPPPGCTEHCEPVIASGGSEQGSGGGLPAASSDAGGGTFTDVNPPPFDGNVLP